jgi:hypothetical protein
VPTDAEARFARAALLAAALVASTCVLADTRTLYRWTDAQGRVQYSDKPPTGFKGEVTRIETELDTNTQQQPAAAPRVAPEVLRDVVAPPADINKTRRDTRERLEAAVKKAEQKVAAAKAALEGGEDPQDTERQMVQRRFARPQAGRSNCRPVADANGKTVFNCPASVPNEEYYERIRGLEEDVKKAEEELDQAKTAYRRGVD